MQHPKRYIVAAAAAALVSIAVASGGWSDSVNSSGTLDTTQRDALLHMVEEEKLAHDVYLTLGAQNDLAIFDRIGSAETRHEAEVQSLLSDYGIADPTIGHDVGEFTNPEFTALYDQLVEQGSESNAAALRVGVTIEEVDIVDLESRLDASTPDDIAQAFERLLAGSERHLQAFTRTLASG